MLKKSFVEPSAPVLRTSPPNGDVWIHEVKFDGWRVQLHKDADAAVVYSRRGNDMTKRFRCIRDSVLSLRCHSAIIDAELVVCDSDGKPDFNALMARSTENLCAWCFDLLEIDGRELRNEPLIARKAILRELLVEADDDTLRYSDEFPDAAKLLAVAERMGLEGIVSKKADQAYVSGKNPGWIKIKTAAWRGANRDRWEMFQKTA